MGISESPLRFACESFHLDGRIAVPADADLGCVVCHPHPQYGGNMNNPVVVAIVRALHAAGVATLRFDFRGVGASGGRHGGGGPEVEDVRAAVRALADQSKVRRLAVAGYSFGSVVALRLAAERKGGLLRVEGEIETAVAVAPPLALLDRSFATEIALPVLLIAGDRDAYCPVATLKGLLPPFDPDVVCAEQHPHPIVIEGADHFFSGYEHEVGEEVARYLAPERFDEGPDEDE